MIEVPTEEVSEVVKPKSKVSSLLPKVWTQADNKIKRGYHPYHKYSPSKNLAVWQKIGGKSLKLANFNKIMTKTLSWQGVF